MLRLEPGDGLQAVRGDLDRLVEDLGRPSLLGWDDEGLIPDRERLDYRRRLRKELRVSPSQRMTELIRELTTARPERLRCAPELPQWLKLRAGRYGGSH